MYNGHIISVKTSGKYKIAKVTARNRRRTRTGYNFNMTLWAILVDLVTGDLSMNAIDN